MEKRENFGSHGPENNEDWGSLSYSGETNIDSETGEERTFTIEDNYRQNPGESDEEYGKRIADIKGKIDEFQYSESDFGAKEALEQSKLARLRALQNSRQHKYGTTDNPIDKDLADKIAQSEARIEGYRLDYKDSQSVGTPEEQERYFAWQKSVDKANEDNLVGRENIVHREIVDDIVEDEPMISGRTAEDDRKAMIIENEDNELKRFRTKEYAESKYGKIEQELEAKFDKLSDNIDELFENGLLTREERNQKLDQAMSDFLEKVDLNRKEYEKKKKDELIGKLSGILNAKGKTPAKDTGEGAPEETPEDKLKRLKAEREDIVKEIEKRGGIAKIKEKIGLLRQKISIINKILTSRKADVAKEGPFLHYAKHELKLDEEDVSSLLYEGEHRGGEDDEYFKKWWDGLDETKQKLYDEKQEKQEARFESHLESLTGDEKAKFQDIIDHYPRYKEDRYFNERWEALSSQQKRELQTMMSGWPASDKRGQALRNWMRSNHVL
ncbi:hypothetical protein IKG33_01750 [Candidatus Saccharibacteria bacterium]|nr:hypothetical protein [Candidatus Saccharibacteria bacterium]